MTSDVRNQRRPYAPGGLPCFLVMTADAEADLAVRLETAARSKKSKAGRTERICGWQDDSTVVDSIAIGRIWGPAEGKVPFE